MSDVEAGAVLTLVIPLGLLVLVLALWGLQQWRAQGQRRASAVVEGGSGPPDG